MTIIWIYNMPLNPEAGGTERITSLVAKGLELRGHKCMNILEFKECSDQMTYNGATVADLYSFLKDNHVDIVINQIAYAKWLLEAFLSRGGERWRSEGGKIISCLHFDPCNPSYKQLLKSQGKLSLRNCIEIIKHTLLSAYYKHRKEKGEGDVYNYIYDNSDIFVILSDHHQSYMKRVMKRQDYDKIIVINNPLTFQCSATDKDLDMKEKILLVCARMSEYHKRISIVLKAWKLLENQGVAREWCLELVGEGPDFERYKNFIKKNHLKQVKLHGRQNPLPYYQKASILLLTSSAEGWGLSITEALQNGVVPVVMNSSPVYSDIIDHCYNGYLTPNNDILSFAQHCKALMTDPRRLRAMQKNAIESSKKFDINKTIDRWEQIL